MLIFIKLHMDPISLTYFFQSVLIPVNVGWSYLLRPFQNSYGCADEMWEWISNFVKRWLDRALLTYAGIKVKSS